MPPYFSGEKKSWKAFNSALATYLFAYEEDFADDRAKILFTLSLLRREDGADCPAADWAENWKGSNLLVIGRRSKNIFDFERFYEGLEETFEDRGDILLAQQRLLALKQSKSQSLGDFLTSWELLAQKAGYEPHQEGVLQRFDAHLISLIAAVVNRDIVSQMYIGRAAVPETYKAYRSALVAIDQNNQMGRAIAQPTPTFWRPAAAQKTASEATKNTQGASRSTGTGTAPNLAKSTPAPMDVDRSKTSGETRKCYNCDQTGHLSKDCTEPRRPRRFNTRAVMAQIDELPADSQELKDLVEKLRGKGF